MNDATHQPPAPEPAATTETRARAERRPATIDLAAHTVTLEGIEYSATALPQIAADWCELRGLASRLQAADDPKAEFAKLQAGTIPSHGPAKTKELDPWRKAYGHALADKQAKERGIKAKSPEFTTLLDECMQAAHGLDRAGLVNAKRIPAVVGHWNRITGNEATL